LLWILALAKARSAAPISAAISAKRATKASAKINATLEGARQKGSWPRKLSGLAASLGRYSPLRGCASLAPCHPPFCLYARPMPVFQQSPSALWSGFEHWAGERGHVEVSVRSNAARRESHPFYEGLGFARVKTQHAYRKQIRSARGPSAGGS